MSGGRWARYDAASRVLTLTIHARPGAAASAVAGLHGDALGIRIGAPAADDKANAELIDYLRRLLGVPVANIRLCHGARGRRKIVAILDADAALLARLESLARD